MPDTMDRVYDSAMYLDYEPAGLGDDNTVRTTVTTRETQIFKETHRILNTSKIKTDVGANIEGINTSIAYTASREDEITTYFEKMDEKFRKDQIESHVHLKDDEDYGTLLYLVDLYIGGKLATIALGHSFPTRWTKQSLSNTIEAFNNPAVTPSMLTLISKCNITGYSPSPHKCILFPPVFGKTCHHVKFLKPHDDTCQDDGKWCATLSGQFVVCYHNDYQSIGGLVCNCDNIDGDHVIKKSPVALNHRYDGHISREGKWLRVEK
jgi:hypothetical protein